MITEIDDLQSTNTNDVYLGGISNIPLIKGDKGNKGDKGDKGDIGPQGVQGPKGDKGDSYDDTKLKQDISDIEEELKQLQEDFYQNSIRGQASGEYIHVEDSSNCRAKIGIGGNSEQETRSGKNKLACPANFEETTFGIKVKQNNGIYSITGTTTSVGTCMTEKTINNYTIKNGDYLHLVNNVSESRIAFVLWFADGTNDSTSLAETNRIVSLANEAGKTINGISFYCNTKGVNLSLEVKPMICKDSAVTDFEQYGASPSPDYPSSIQSVGDDVNELNPIAGGSQGINSSVIEGKISFSGTANTTFANITSITVGVIKKGTYIFSINEAKNYSVRLRMYYTESEYIDAIIPENKKEVVIELTNDVIKYYTYIYPLTAGTNYNDFIYEKLQKGTTVTPYSPYGQGCINEVICNKNEFSSEWEQGAINVDTGVGCDANNAVRTKDFIRILPNVEYYMSRTIATSYNSYYFYDTNKNLIGKNNTEGMMTSNLTTKNMQVNNYNQIFTINNSEVAYMKIFDVSNDLSTKYLLQRNSLTDKTYITHQSQTYTIPTQQPMRSVGDIRDIFIKKNNKWYERHYIKRKIFDGTINRFAYKHTTIYTDTNGFYQLELPNKILGNTGKIGYGLCNYLEYVNKTASEANKINCMWWENSTKFNYASIPFLTLEEANAWLVELNDNGNPFYIDYVLETPLDIECTEEQSKILDELNNARTYKNVTNIYSTDEISPILSLDYAKDLETLLNNTQALAVNNASEGV